MKIKIKKEIEVNARLLHVEACVRYWGNTSVDGVEDEEGTLIPCREGNLWKPVIDIDSGEIINWKDGLTADIHYKVCDEGRYTITDECGLKLSVKGGYVPDILSPGGCGYGDYIIMSIDKYGLIEMWAATSVDLDVFFIDEED